MKNFWIFLLLFVSNAAYLTMMDVIRAGDPAEAFHTLIHSYIAITLVEHLMISLYLLVPLVSAFIKWRRARSKRASPS